jgi:hypothetical protein
MGDGLTTPTCDQHTTRNNSLGNALATYGFDTFNMVEMKAGLDALNRRMDLLVMESGIDWTGVEARFDDLEAWKVQFKCTLMQTMKEQIINTNLKNSLMASKVAQVGAQMERMIQVAADEESLQSTMLDHMQQWQRLLSDHITSIDEQVDAFDTGQYDMDDVYCCNIKKLFNEIQKFNERYSTMNSQLKVYLARDERNQPSKVRVKKASVLLFPFIFLFPFNF